MAQHMTGGLPSRVVARALAILVAAALVASCQPSASPATAPPSPSATPFVLPASLRSTSWLGATGAWGKVAGTLANEYFTVPESEQGLAAFEGRVLTVDAPPSESGTGIVLREIASGRVLLRAELPVYPFPGRFGDGVIYFSGYRPDPAGPPGEIIREIPGAWRVGLDGSVVSIVEAQPVPEEWGDDTVARILLLSPSGRSLISRVCHSSGVLGPAACDVDVIGTEDGSSRSLLRGALGPVLASDSLIVLSDTLVTYLEARDLQRGELLWSVSLGQGRGGPPFWAGDGVHLAVAYWQDEAPPGSWTMALIDATSGELRDLVDWQESDLGRLWVNLSGGGYAVLGHGSDVNGALVEGGGSTTISLLDLATGELAADVWELSLPPAP